VLGGVETNKNVDVIIEALSNFKGDRSFWEAHIAGGVGEMCQDILGLPAKLGIGSNALFHGRLGDERFKKLLSEMDLLISLRYPTMGETSGVVTRAVQMGIPVIVNDIGWYSELPDFANKLSTENMHDELLRVLRRYVFDPNYVKEKKKKFVEYAQSELNVERIIKTNLDILATEYRNRCNQKPIETISDLFNDLNSDNVPTMERAARKLQIIFDK
jgi:glycosyltransferase involved in cell wall biosynthesis